MSELSTNKQHSLYLEARSSIQHAIPPAQEVWLPGNDIQDPTTWIVPSLRTLKHLHETLLQDYDCTSRLQTSPHRHQMRAAARRQTPGRHLHRRPLAPKTSVRAPLSFHSSTASMRHTS